MGAPLLPPELNGETKGNTSNKTKIIKVRVSPEEYQTMIDMAQKEGGISALIRNRVFRLRTQTRQLSAADVLMLGRIHATLLLVARQLDIQSPAIERCTMIAYLVAAEHHLEKLITL